MTQEIWPTIFGLVAVQVPFLLADWWCTTRFRAGYYRTLVRIPMKTDHEPLPPLTEANLLDFSGTVEHLTYKYDTEAKALFFHSVSGWGRRARVVGKIHLQDLMQSKHPRIYWAPWPVTFVGASIFLAPLLGMYLTQLPQNAAAPSPGLSAPAIVLAIAIAIAINGAFWWYYARNARDQMMNRLHLQARQQPPTYRRSSSSI